MLDVVDYGGHVSLGNANNPVRHFFGNQTVEVPDNAHDGDVDVGENVSGRAQD